MTTPQSTQAPYDEPDPLAKLHRMSTTAGVASQQYVAVNVTSIVAVIIGLVSSLAVLEPVLLFIPLAGVIVGLVAWRQVRGSNGTETGTPLALLGLGLSLGFGGYETYTTVTEHLRVSADVRHMSEIATGLGEDLKAKRYSAAYQRFDVVFRERISEETFRTRWELFQRPEAYGPFKGLEWNGAPPMYQSIQGGGQRAGLTTFILRFERNDTGRFSFLFRDPGGGWQLEDVPDIFPQKNAKGE